MPSYDPQRSRSRRRAADDEGPAPVDALLGPLPDEPAAAPDPDPEPAPPPVVEPARREPLIVDLDQPTPVDVPRRRGRAVLLLVAALSVLVQVLLFLWWRRRRSRPSG